MGVGDPRLFIDTKVLGSSVDFRDGLKVTTSRLSVVDDQNFFRAAKIPIVGAVIETRQYRTIGQLSGLPLTTSSIWIRHT